MNIKAIIMFEYGDNLICFCRAVPYCFYQFLLIKKN